jgi:REP element-mobilizing transposase RayT
MLDHIHMSVSVPPKYSIAMTIGYLKGKSAIREESAGFYFLLRLCAPLRFILNILRTSAVTIVSGYRRLIGLKTMSG